MPGKVSTSTPDSVIPQRVQLRAPGGIGARHCAQLDTAAVYRKQGAEERNAFFRTPCSVPVPVPVPVPGGARRRRSSVQSARHVDEHGDDTDEELACGLAPRSGDELESGGDIEDGRTLGG